MYRWDHANILLLGIVARSRCHLVGHIGTGIAFAAHVADLEVARRHVCKQQRKMKIIESDLIKYSIDHARLTFTH